MVFICILLCTVGADSNARARTSCKDTEALLLVRVPCLISCFIFEPVWRVFCLEFAPSLRSKVLLVVWPQHTNVRVFRLNDVCGLLKGLIACFLSHSWVQNCHLSASSLAALLPWAADIMLHSVVVVFNLWCSHCHLPLSIQRLAVCNAVFFCLRFALRWTQPGTMCMP